MHQITSVLAMFPFQSFNYKNEEKINFNKSPKSKRRICSLLLTYNVTFPPHKK